MAHTDDLTSTRCGIPSRRKNRRAHRHRGPLPGLHLLRAAENQDGLGNGLYAEAQFALGGFAAAAHPRGHAPEGMYRAQRIGLQVVLVAGVTESVLSSRPPLKYGGIT